MKIGDVSEVGVKSRRNVALNLTVSGKSNLGFTVVQHTSKYQSADGATCETVPATLIRRHCSE
jgi:hypothetical protein